MAVEDEDRQDDRRFVERMRAALIYRCLCGRAAPPPQDAPDWMLIDDEAVRPARFACPNCVGRVLAGDSEHLEQARLDLLRRDAAAASGCALTEDGRIVLPEDMTEDESVAWAEGRHG